MMYCNRYECIIVYNRFMCCILQLDNYSHVLHENGYIAKREHMDCMFLSMEKGICSASSLVKFVTIQRVVTSKEVWTKLV
jgi:hypothetical protein